MGRLLWQSYFRTALIPLLIVELGFLVIYWGSSNIIYNKTTENMSAISRQYFIDIAQRETATIGASLDTIASHTRIFARQTGHALDGNYVPPSAERARYRLLPSGGLHTAFDNGTTASLYSGGTNVGRKEMEKVWNLTALDPLMISVKQSNPIVASIYFNTFDNYTKIFPYVDMASNFSEEVDATSYNFYYEADLKNNPARRGVWTDAYVDPAGHGWMVSSIAPVWRNEKLEGVVGIDMTLTTIIERLLDLDLPWDGYAILVDQNGVIIAMPPAGEKDFGLDELTDHAYSEAIMENISKPDEFNVNRRKDTLPLANAIRQMREGNVQLDLGGPRLASFAIVPQTGWHLVIIAPTENIYSDARALYSQLKIVGYFMLSALLVFYLLFFALLIHRARIMTRMIAEPMAQISGFIEHLEDRRADPKFAGSKVDELDRLGHHLVATRLRLLEAEEESGRQTKIAHTALNGLRKANNEMTSFTRLMSHEIRTPLSIIDGSAQIMLRKAEMLTPEDLRERAGRLRSTVARMTDILSKLLNHFDAIAADLASQEKPLMVNLCSEVRSLAEAVFPRDRLRLSLPDSCGCESQVAYALIAAMREILGGAIYNGPVDHQVEITLECHSGSIIAVIAGAALGERGAWSQANVSEILMAAGGSLSIETSPGGTSIIILVPATAQAVS